VEKNHFLDIVDKQKFFASPSMAPHFRYILVGLIFFLIYLVYLVGYYEFEQYQTNTYVRTLEGINSQIASRNTEKQELTLYIRTSAYHSFVAKATQNKKLPGEEVFNIVDEANLRASEDINVGEIIRGIQKEESSPTRNMTNPEKWQYIFLHFRDYL
jgi:hypothetical protein